MEKLLAMRADFPLLEKTINGYPIAYLDNAATSLKPQVVLDAMTTYYTDCSGSIYRGVYAIGEQATTLYEDARSRVAAHIGAQPHEIVFTKGATEGINAIAMAWAYKNLRAGDEIVVSALEHHANILPWHWVAQHVGAQLKIIPIDCYGNLRLDLIEHYIGPRTKLVAICHVSNVLGVRNDVKLIARCAHECGARVLIDAAQSAPHEHINVKDLDPDFLVFSGHKMMGPTGIGVLYCAERIHDQLSPYQYGGGMVNVVDFETPTFLPMPHLLEAGTPPIAAAIGLARAIDYMHQTINFDELQRHEASLSRRLIKGLQAMKKVKIHGPMDQLQLYSHIVSFSVDGVHPHDGATFCDQYGICLRAGVHCAQPLAKWLSSGPTLRSSVYAYNTTEEIDRLLMCVDVLTS